MANSAPRPPIRLRGVRHNNLKNFDLDLPTGQLVVITGLSGSGKSSLAFDTLFAEGQRRYIETFSPYARQFFDRMDKPQVDRIEGIPPAIAVEQRNLVRTTRSTVGTMTELCEHMKLLWPHLAELHCRACGQPVRRDPPQLVWETIRREARQAAPPHPPERLVTFSVPLSDKLSLEESLSLVARQGYQRLLCQGRILRVEEALPHLQAQPPKALTVVQDRLRIEETSRARWVEACEQAYHFGHGKLAVYPVPPAGTATAAPRHFSSGFHCAACDLDYREPSPALFSFNHPLGACPTCRGFGRTIAIDYHLALPDRSKTLAQGVVRPWQTGQGQECQTDLMKFCRIRKVPVDVPFEALSKTWQEWVLQGDPGYGQDDAHRWPKAWYGVAGYFRWLDSKAYKMHVRVLLSRYRTYFPCPDCHGKRFQPDALLYRLRWPDGDTLTLADFYQLPLGQALAKVRALAGRSSPPLSEPLRLVLEEVQSRLGYLVQVGLEYLTLDRPTRTLSGGETERVNLTTCLGSRLVNTLFVLDEPSVGLHARDTRRLVRILEQLRDTGNTVVVVEHEAQVIRAANQIVDLGPGQGQAGGHIVFQGASHELRRAGNSLTAAYLQGAKQAAVPRHRPVAADAPRLRLSGAHRHNLKHFSVDLPLERFVCLTGVSGSGKSTLARDLLFPALEARLRTRALPAREDPAGAEAGAEAGNSAGDRGAEDDSEESSGAQSASLALSGDERLAHVLLVDQSPLGRTPRSNPAVYVGAFDALRELYAQTELARQRGLNASAFSFNSGQGQCERCRGAGFEKIEMQFLSDVQIRCPDCGGRRYRSHILEIKLPVAAAARGAEASGRPEGGWSIADLLEASVDDAMQALLPYQTQAAGDRALRRLRYLQEVGLGYLQLGQPINTLSGGESQRLKLAAHLAGHDRTGRNGAGAELPTLFIFDEPTTGLHFHDVWVLLQAFQRLVDGGHSLLVIEHNLDVIQSADWVIDLGPEGGDAGGRLVAEGTPEEIARHAGSLTGEALREVMLGEAPPLPGAGRGRARRAKADFSPVC